MRKCRNLTRRNGGSTIDESSADLNVIVDGESSPAHEASLVDLGDCSRSLFCKNDQTPNRAEAVLDETSLAGFKFFMRYLHTGKLTVGEAEEDLILEALELANLLGSEEVTLGIRRYLKENLSAANVCTIFHQAHELKLEDICNACLDVVSSQASRILDSDTFCSLPEAALCHMLSSDEFRADELEIFKAVARWCAKQPSETNLSKVLSTVRLPLITVKDLVTTVKASGLISTEQLLDAIEEQGRQTVNLNPRVHFKSRTNLATPDCGAVRLTASSCEASGTSIIWSELRSEPMPSYPRKITISAMTGLTVELKGPFLINHIAFKLPHSVIDSYRIEVSMNRLHWIRVIDYRNWLCESFQNLFFETRPARFIRLICTGKVDMKISAFEVTHVVEPFKLIGDFYAPEKNVASVALGTRFGLKKKKVEPEVDEQHEEGDGESDEEEEGFVSADEESFEDEEDEDEDEDEEDEESAFDESSERMTHEIGNEFIVITFPQPYVVDSMRMLLRHDHSRAYKYYIETSMDYQNWRRVADNTADYCRSWQRITFDAHPVIFIRIVGTASSLDNHFSLSHFECPAPEESSLHGSQESIGQESI